MQAELDLQQPTVAKTPDVVCPEIAARVPTWAQLRERFADLHPRLQHVGVDDSNCEWFAARSLAVAEAAAEGQKLPEARAVLRRGAPNSQRRALWCLALCLPHNVSRYRHSPLACAPRMPRAFCTALSFHGSNHVQGACRCCAAMMILV